ncbi:ferroxidase HEPHL1-like isoform X2 [Neoarius graeffei]|uniref:ferroxidase HEPHL1-like isoform X2 n=1 Tax=Neoarius graeffei TaxID=443677 RepID=UPI00298CADF0|nr:ferroxidase HEPHL1-like isoform X2 [Neoarius graeffei]
MTTTWTFCFALLTLLHLSESVIRTYYIGIREEYWNYAPTERNLISGLDIKHDERASKYLVNSQNRIGSVYKKALYRRYTDGTFTTEEPRLQWLGFLGPVIRAEVGDVIKVHLKNFASRHYSIHPHGVLYKKDSEGAWYPDGTSGVNKSDDAVAPGQAYMYTWNVTEEFGPKESDSTCLTSMYHSHVNAPKDIATGLIGVLLICRKGALDPSALHQIGMPHEFFLMFSAVDENLSWYLENNTEMYCHDDMTLNEDPLFQESNRLHSINGFVYGNLPTLEVCLGRPVFWHLLGIGNTIDLHSIHFHGHTLLNQGHRTDVVSVFPATSVTAKMVPMTAGKWLFGCQIDDYMHAGMQGFYEVLSCDNATAPTAPPVHVRRYYIAAEEVLWDYAPSGKNGLTNKPLNESESDSEEFFSTNDGRLGGKYWKVRYVGYHDEAFTSKIEQSGSEHHLGILGPVIRGEPGDVIEVTFRNKAQYNFSMQPHGVSYDKAYEGVIYQDGSQKAGASVAPGQTFTYRWRVTEGPSSSDPPCLSYLYYSATNPIRDTNSGLVGPLQVCKKGVLDESGQQHIGSEVQKEFFLLFTVVDENESWYLKKNVDEFGDDESDPDSLLFQESNKMHSVNGFMYGNLPELYLCEGDHVVWHLLALGSVDPYGIYFQGNTFQLDNTTRDTLNLFPHSSVTVSMIPDNDGLFELSCLNTDYYRGGMWQLYTVKRCTPSQNFGSEVTTFQPDVTFFLAAEELEWNYAPNRTWELEKLNTTLNESTGSVFLSKSENQIGPAYKKVVYRKYKDETFTKQDARGPEEEHLGILGPILRVQVGEKVQVVFKNKASIPYSVHVHGVKTSKAQPVSPGHTTRYNWTISSGPGPTESNCINYAYYSSVNSVKDLASGLVGPLVVCRKGTLNKSRQRIDVDKEFALLFMVFDENESWYLQDNIRTYLKKDPKTFDMDHEDFMEKNMMHGINGKLYANLHGLKMQQGDRTEWYLMALGNGDDIHTVHFHDQSFIYKTDHPHRADVYALFPGTFRTIELKAGTPGTWLLHCHVSDHIDAGMETTFTIDAANSTAWTHGITFLQSFCQILLAIILAFWL